MIADESGTEQQHQREEQRAHPSRVMPSVACGSVGTGTESVPSPSVAGRSVTRTCHAPAVIIQRWPMNRRGSCCRAARDVGHRRELARRARSAAAARCALRATSDDVVSTSTSATPGIGVRRPDGDQQRDTVRPGRRGTRQGCRRARRCREHGREIKAISARQPRKSRQARKRMQQSCFRVFSVFRWHAALGHRLTRCIARPACSPSHIIRHESSAAISMPRQNCAGGASFGIERCCARTSIAAGVL